METNGQPTKRSKWTIASSHMAKRTFNPIRTVVDGMKLEPNPDKDLISLSIGDPTVFGNLGPSQEMKDAVVSALNSGKSNGYAPSVGYEHARAAVAKRFSTPDIPLKSKDVVFACGCSEALEMAILVLANPGQNVLIPKPGFSLYWTICQAYGIDSKHYDLLPERSWEIDLDHLESLIDENTSCIVVNNPSNPCGSVFTKDHILDICSVARRHKLPIIADEVYADMVFSESEFHSVSSLSEEIPVLTCGGLAKRFLCPGWRMGWIIMQSRTGAFDEEIRHGLFNLSTRVLGPCTLIQAALPDIFDNSRPEFYSHAMEVFESNAKLAYKTLKQIKGLNPIMPQGAMYLMCGLDPSYFADIKDDQDFVEKLMCEESVFCLPAKVFEYPNYFRIVLSVPPEKVKTACQRIEEFCLRHSKQK